MVKPLRRVRMEDEPDLKTVLADLRTDKAPRVIEQDGVPIAIVLDPSDYPDEKPVPKSRINRDRILEFAGIWSDIDADQMIADIRRWRHEAPPSPDPSLYFDEPETPQPQHRG